MQLSGNLPDDIGQFTELQILYLVGCGFTGPIPGTIGYLENLIFFSLNSNGFTGPIPASIGNHTNLQWLDLNGNKLTGSIPVSNGTTPGLDLLTKAQHFHLGDNQLSGDIPPALFNMRLIHLLLENNKLTGNIPSTLGLVTSLIVVRLDRNSLRGLVPSNINSLINLQNMFMYNNQLSGTKSHRHERPELYSEVIPPWFSTLQALRTIKMHKTKLGGQLPAALFSIPQLQIVNLSSNRIIGPLNISPNPSTQLQLVDLGNNLIGDFNQQSEYSTSIGLILVGNPICRESGVTESFCSSTTKSTTPYSTPQNKCVTASCDSGLVLSPICQCALPYTGSFFFKAPFFSSLENPSIYSSSLHDSLMEFFQNASLPVSSVSLKNATRNVDDYLEIKLEVSHTENQFSLGQRFLGSGMYSFRQKEPAERALEQSQPFALWDPTSGSGDVPQLKGARSFTFEELQKYFGD
ncbi:hypothetical protein L1987_54740 [Smallanthus sonchifolius]|uniref:Uncharacterized protein n=1 Tax=Smallanthus sonchifolius TaxID=185202 RepID=A0ACB9E8L7_9ASTR|nr:hypothetical protein L1987_54740 [Smallanthus sonchifolius]